MASEYHVKIVPDATDFVKLLRAALDEALGDEQIGVLTNEVTTFEYDVHGRVVKQSRSVYIGGGA